MKFGKTLKDKIHTEWIASAVDYRGMKKALPKPDDPLVRIPHDDDPTSSSTTTATTTPSYEQFWTLYDSSLANVSAFHEEKVHWAKEQLQHLQQEVEAAQNIPHSSSSSDTTKTNLTTLASSCTNYISELDLILEFLELNFLAFSKILKKFDKRTIGHVRQTKLDDIVATHPFFNRREMLQFKAEGCRLREGIQTLMKKQDLWRQQGTGIHGMAERRMQAYEEEQRQRKAKELKWLNKARTILDGVGNSPFFVNHPMRQNPAFEENEIQLGPYLGEGEFSTVREVKAFHVNESCPICMLETLRGHEDHKSMPTSDSVTETESHSKKDDIGSIQGLGDNKMEEETMEESKNGFKLSIGSVSSEVDLKELDTDHMDHVEELVSHRGFMKHHCMRNGIARYAIKQLKSSLNARKKFDGAIDIAIEAKFLSSLSHSNIVKICGTGGVPGHPGFFLVLDRLYDTLADKMNVWAKRKKEFKGGLFTRKSKSELEFLWVERLLALYDIARAMKYLHSQEVIYRDLKPENIGFDVRDNAKIFDFGLAKELRTSDRIAKDQYKASGRTGTRRYMAPEVTLCKPYGKPADAYSFAVLSWGILALKTPFDNYSYEKHAKQVVQDGKRPVVPKKWPTMIKELLSGGWASDPSARNNFDQIVGLLGGELENKSYSVLDRTNKLMDTSFSGLRMNEFHLDTSDDE